MKNVGEGEVNQQEQSAESTLFITQLQRLSAAFRRSLVISFHGIGKEDKRQHSVTESEPV
jgi:hypothetical protein